MEADGSGADGFEFNLTRVLESLDHGEPTDLGVLAATVPAAPIVPADPTPLGVPAAGAPAPLTITPVSDPPALTPLPTRVPSRAGAPAGPAVEEPLATRSARTATAPAPAEPLPTRRAAAPSPELVPPGRRSVFDEAASGEARATLHRVPVDHNIAQAALESPVLPAPTLPAAAAAAPPAAAAVVETAMPTAADVRQFQSTQRRQARRNRQGRVMGRVVVVFVLFVGAVGAALTIGRDYLFPADWADDLAPLVGDVERSRGAEFANMVPLVDEPADAYAATVSDAVLGAAAGSRISVWRALGVATGDIDPAAVGAELAQAQPAVYDAESETIVRREGAAADLRPALTAALDAQLADDDQDALSLLGPIPAAALPDDPAGDVSDLSTGGLLSPPVGAIAAAQEVMADPAFSTAPTFPPSDPATVTSTPVAEQPALPVGEAALPVAYQLAASERLAPELLGGTHTIRPALTPLAPEATLLPGDEPLAGPSVLSLDDWTLVWANRLPESSVDTLLAATTANSLRTFERADTLCVGAVFEAGNEMFAAAIVAELGAWAAAGPVEAQAVVTQVAATYVQLVTCDPGAVAQTVNPAAVDVVVARQLARVEPVAAAPATTTPASTPATAVAGSLAAASVPAGTTAPTAP